MESFELVHWLGLAAIMVPSLFAFVDGFLRFVDFVRSPLSAGLYLSISHAFIVEQGILTCLPRSMIDGVKAKAHFLGVDLVLRDGASIACPIFATELGVVEKWLDNTRSGDVEWPGEVFLSWTPTWPQAPSGMSLGDRRAVRHSLTLLPARLRQELRELIDGRRAGLRFPEGQPNRSFHFLVVAGGLLVATALLAHRADFPNLAVYAISYGLACLILFTGMREVDYRYFHPIRPGVYVDSRHLFAVGQENVLVFGLQEMRITGEVRLPAESAFGTEVKMDVDGWEHHLRVPDPDFKNLLRMHLSRLPQFASEDAPTGGEEMDPWLDPSEARGQDGNRSTWMSSRFRRAFAFFASIVVLAGIFDQTAGRALGYWIQLHNYKSWRNRAAILESVGPEAPEWFRSRLEREVWMGVQRRQRISELIWFLNWPGSRDFRSEAEAKLREAALLEWRVRDTAETADRFRSAWLAQVGQTGKWNLRVSVRDPAATWPGRLLGMADPAVLARSYDSVVAKAIVDVLSEQAHLPDSLPVEFHSVRDDTPPLLVVESVAMDSAVASGESYRFWSIASGGSHLVDLRLPVDAWQISQLRLPAKESALPEFLRSEIRRKLAPIHDTFTRVGKEGAP